MLRQCVRRFGSGFSLKKKVKGQSGVREDKYEDMLKGLRGTPGPEVEQVELSQEERARHFEIGREYNKQTTLRENRWRVDLDLKIKLKWAAIHALPDELLTEALEPDAELIPYERRIPTWTPAIPEMVSEDSSSSSIKLS